MTDLLNYPVSVAWLILAAVLAITAYGIAGLLGSATSYHQRYGYPPGWALAAEIAWRAEHWDWLGDRITARFYRWRKALERRGYAAGHAA